MSEILAADKVTRIRDLNDYARMTFTGCAVMITPAVQALPADTKRTLLRAVREFDAFTEDNDPHGEHDFISVTVESAPYFAKFDYYDTAMQGGSEDPSDPAKTRRVLTIMRSDEY